MLEIKELSTALAKAQGQIQSAKKTSENPAFKKADGKKSTYADLNEVIEVIQGPASENGLSVIFDFKLDVEVLFINYVIMHSSGEQIVGSPVPMFLRDKTVHGFGASNTFMRRQLLKAIYQIPEEDDDGNAASAPQKVIHNPPKLSTPKQPVYDPSTYFNPDIEETEPDQRDPHTMTPMEEIMVIKTKLGLTNEQMSEIVLRVTGRKTTKECGPDEIQSVLIYLRMK